MDDVKFSLDGLGAIHEETQRVDMSLVRGGRPYATAKIQREVLRCNID